MKRITFSLPDDTAERFEAFLAEHGYTNRSEAFRDLIRKAEADRLSASDDQPCAAVVSYVFNHNERRLAERTTETQHEHLDVVHSVMHVHVGPEDCLESLVLLGKTGAVLEAANRILAEPGVRHGRINLIPSEAKDGDGDGHSHGHVHGHSHGHEHKHDHKHDESSEC
ncbi:nickel-responsive transcriptional regulator NikR [Sutterella megalosphaeroides]|uniref:Putative nickel-responsive regulator n=1 Tax=Sutterella megalosphaeroides TaxID=2494234 RepID=A0A2Z6IAW5_9BURK|nr:nickel-responsive transcriptional regulator NikR [Sutterella megalosphaeroides]BBF23675.1 hypothetical protein SUTMEG_15660 [Sutterella megalosphaeroides]